MAEALAAEPDARIRPLDGATDADVCVVGGGYVGLWTAVRIAEAEPDARVVVLEADVCGSGASGRNGGFAFGWWPKIETLIERVGEEDALRLGRAAEAAINELEEFCDAEKVDAHFHRGGWLWTATSEAQLGAWRGAMKACRRLGVEPFEELDPEVVRGRTGSPAHVGGAFEGAAATVQPALLCRGLRRVAEERGVAVHEHSAAMRMDRDAGIVTTAKGSVRAGSIVLATNAWMAGLGELRRAIAPLSSDVVATAPIPGGLARTGWSRGEGITDSRLMVHYYRKTHDGRVVFGKGGGGLGRFGRFPGGFDYDAERAQRATEFLHRLVPATRDVPIVDVWGGAVDRSSDGLPFFGSLDGRVPIHYGVGFSGNGIVPSVLAGRILAALALGRDDEWSSCGLARGVPGRFPPEPLRFVGGTVIKAAVRRKERLEDDGREVGRLNLRLAALAPSGFFKQGKGDD